MTHVEKEQEARALSMLDRVILRALWERGGSGRHEDWEWWHEVAERAGRIRREWRKNVKVEVN